MTETQLKPYVAIEVKQLTIEDSEQWPFALSKTEDEVRSKRGGIYGRGGFDGEYYLQLAEHYDQAKKTRQEGGK